MLSRNLIATNEVKCFQTVSVSLKSADKPEKLSSQNNFTPLQRAEIVVGEGRQESSLQQIRGGNCGKAGILVAMVLAVSATY